MPREPLPIDPLLPAVVESLRSARSLVLQAAPGAGKTTRVPPALLEAGLVQGELWVLEPRRLATRLAAARVADELGETVGRTVGYQIRFEEVASRQTRIRFVTEGVLGRRLLSDPGLRGVGAVVLDEFHERHLASDLGLALLRRLLSSRPELRLVVMSATLDTGPLAEFLGHCPVLTSEGRVYSVEVEHLPAGETRALEQQVLAGLKRLAPRVTDGHVLVFLPGAGEIRRAQEVCREYAERHGFTVHALHGDLPPEAQDRAVRPSPGRKLILSTNVAETSVTIEGVAAVLDSGLARIASHSPWTGLPTLRLAPISRASAIQRAGRAGRTRAGHCLRLYTRADFEMRPEREVPEIAREDLAETVLALAAMGVPDPLAFDWFEPPPTAALESAGTLLADLGARAPDGTLTAVGRRLLDFPIHPRLARIVVEGERRGVGPEATLAVAVLGERPLRRDARAQLGSGPRQTSRMSARSDVLEALEELDRARAGRREGLDPGAVEAIERMRRQLARALVAPPRPKSVSRSSSGRLPASAPRPDSGRRHNSALRPDSALPPTSTPSPNSGPLPPAAPRPETEAGREEALLISLLAGFPDRVARRRKPHTPELLLSTGGAAVLDPVSVVQEPLLLLALDAEERRSARGTEVRVRMASAIEPEWLLDLFPERLRDEDRLLFNEESERVERLSRLAYGALTLEERRVSAEPSEAAEAVLAEAVRTRGIDSLVGHDVLAGLRARLDLAASALPAERWPPTDDGTLALLLARGRRSLAEVRQVDLARELLGTLEPRQAALLARELPDRISLPGGRSVAVHYAPGQPPWIASRLQDFFGLHTGPALARGRVPLVLHLLAPNQRAVQVTQDLTGFWSRHYPALRRELARRYPRHSWPEDPLRAAPPPPRRG
jgi:ATP-dependent helicase HrpB